MTDFSGAFSDLIPTASGPVGGNASTSGITITPLNADGTAAPVTGNKFDSAFADLVPTKAAGPSPSIVGSALDFLKSIPGGVVSSLANTASTGGQAAQIEMGQPVTAPDAAATDQAIQQNVTGPLPQSQGTAGKFGRTVGEFVGNPASYIVPGTLPAKLGMAALSGIGSEAGGQLAAGTPYETAARIAGSILGGGAAAKIAQPAAVEAAIGPAPAAVAPSVEDLKSAATAGYESPVVKGVTLAAEPVANQVSGIMSDLASDGIHPVLAPKTFGILQDAATAPANAVVTVDNLQALRRTLGKAAMSIDPTERYAAQRAMAGVDKIMTEMEPDAVLSGDPGAATATLKTANANYSAAKTAEALDTRINNTELAADSAHSGMNLGNKLRQQAVAVLKSDKAKRGLKPDEIAMLEGLARGNATRNSIRFLSNLLGGGGGLGAVVTGEVASHALGPFGWALSLGGHVLKHLENHLTVAAANKISEAIRMRSPLGQAIQSSAEKWNAARDALVKGPNSAKFAAFSLASRNLSNNLASAGVKVHPRQLLGAVQNPVPADAQDQQQQP